MTKQHCCSEMKRQIDDWKCDQHEERINCPDAIIDYSPKFDEYGIMIHDGGSSFIIINYCPWCGQKLPESKRDRWFKKLKELGFDDPVFSDDIPEEYKTDEWYK